MRYTLTHDTIVVQVRLKNASQTQHRVDFMKYRNIVIAGYMLLLSFGVGATHLSAQTQSITLIDADEVFAKTLNSDQYNEYWNYQMYFDNGMSLYIQFSVSNFGRMKSSVSGIRVSMYGLDGQDYHINREYPIEDLRQDPAIHEFNINPRQMNIWFKGTLPETHQVYINTQKHGHRFKIDVNLNDIVQGIRLQNPEFMLDDHRLGMQTQIPYARVSGTVGINDNVKTVRGVAYMDHTWQYQNSSKKLAQGYRFVRLNSESNWESIYFMEGKTNNGSKSVGYRVSRTNGGSVQLQTISDIRQSDPNEIRNNRYLITFNDGTKMSIEKHLVQDETSIFTDLNWVTRQLMRAILGGEIKDTRGSVQINTNGQNRRDGYFNRFKLD